MSKQLSKDEAIALGKTEWWKDVPLEEAAKFQLTQSKLCMDFSAFHEGVEKLLGRPVWTHEFAHNDRLIAEACGDAKPPTMLEIIEMIPPQKRVVVIP